MLLAETLVGVVQYRRVDRLPAPVATALGTAPASRRRASVAAISTFGHEHCARHAGEPRRGRGGDFPDHRILLPSEGARKPTSANMRRR
jgi:hypothetical protein